METKNIMIVGVGGQGSLLASKLLGHLLMEQGYDVKVSEVHGMSQRGGSVVAYVRYGDRVNSPVIDKGEADFIVSFELLEAARWLSYLKPDGQIVTNTQQIDPMPVITGAAQYPENLVEKMKAAGAAKLPPFKIRRNQAFFPSSNAFLFSSKNFAGTIASRDFCQASSGRSK